MDLDFMVKMIVPIVLAACLVVGYLLKNFAPNDNKWIPVIVTILGAVIGCIAFKGITLEAVVAGAVTGLASTGMHQLLKETFGLGKTKVYKKGE